MKLSTSTSVSIGLILSILLLGTSIFVVLVPSCDKLIYEKDLQAAQKNIDIQYSNLCQRLDRLEKHLQKRFDKLEKKIDNVTK